MKEEKENQEHKEDNLKSSAPFSILQAKPDHSFGQVRPSLPHSQVGGSLVRVQPQRVKHFSLQQAMFGFGPSLENPLQRMASITNSLVSQPLPSPHFSQQKLKAVLPPITQQQVLNVCHLLRLDTTRENQP